VLFIGLFRSGDDENKLTAEKNGENKIFIKSIVLLDFASQFLYAKNNKHHLIGLTLKCIGTAGIISGLDSLNYDDLRLYL